MEDTKEIKVQKMLAMRKFVRDHVFGIEKGNIDHLGQLDLDKEDNTRLVISLQDLLDRILKKKRRAEQYIAELTNMLNTHGDYSIHIGNLIVQARRETQHLKEKLKKRDTQISELEKKLEKTERQLTVFKELFVDQQNQAVSTPPVKEESTVNAATQSWQAISNNYDGSLTGRLASTFSFPDFMI